MSWVPVAKKEFLENVRNAWVLTMAGVFILIVTITAMTVSALEIASGFDAVRALISGMRWASGLVLPLMALLLGHATLAGERESGSLALLVAQPLTRAQVLLGKFVGLFAALALAFVVGAGGAGLVVVLRSGTGAQGLAILGAFVAATLMWGAAWIALTMLISAFFSRRGTAIAGSLGAWFVFSILWVPLMLVAVAGATSGRGPPIGPGEPEAPAWLVLFQVLNPNAAWGGLLSETIGTAPGLVGEVIAQVLPQSGSALLFGIVLAAWTVVPLAGAYALFRTRDV